MVSLPIVFSYKPRVFYIRSTLALLYGYQGTRCTSQTVRVAQLVLRKMYISYMLPSNEKLLPSNEVYCFASFLFASGLISGPDIPGSA